MSQDRKASEKFSPVYFAYRHDSSDSAVAALWAA